MRQIVLAVVLLGLVAFASAGEFTFDTSRPKAISGRLSCVLPISKLLCVRDWRSGFVAGMRYGYDGFDNVGPPPTNQQQWTQVCSPRIFNQTQFDMSIASDIDNAQATAPSWFRGVSSAYYLYPAGSPITQVIVLSAPNPWGEKFGNIPAILFGYLTQDGLDFAVCGNALYAQYYLNPANSPAPPTPVTLKRVYTSPLSGEGILTALGNFEGKCAGRGTQFNAYLGGDPWTNSHFRMKALIKPCFTQYNNTVQLLPTTPSSIPQRILGHFHCDTRADGTEVPECKLPCAWSKKDGKKSASFSCTASGTAIATGKYGLITFDRDGQMFDWDRDERGMLQQVPVDSKSYDPDAIEQEVDEEDQ